MLRAVAVALMWAVAFIGLAGVGDSLVVAVNEPAMVTPD